MSSKAASSKKLARSRKAAFSRKVLTYREALAQTMREALEQHSETVIFGQGVNDHKGTFGTTLGLAKTFGSDRVVDTPLAEEGTTGIAIGAALNGLYPIQVHIRADFSLLAFNQIINMAAKYRYMSGGALEVPMLIRMVIGRSWGQGAQHSQSLQSLFSHIPGLVVLMPSSSQAILKSYPYLIGEEKNPVISLEHRLLYDLKFQVDPKVAPSKKLSLTSYLLRPGKDVTIVATSIMVLEALRAAEHLAKERDIQCEVIDLHSISDPDKSLILESVQKTGRLLVADTSFPAFGVGAEVSRWTAGHDPAALKAPVVTLGMQRAPCPTAKQLEDLYYPNLQTLTDSIAKLVTGKENHGIALPDETSMADVYKRFKGPF